MNKSDRHKLANLHNNEIINNNEFIWSFDQDMRFVYVSNNASNFLKYPADELIGQKISSFLHYSSYEYLKKIFRSDAEQYIDTSTIYFYDGRGNRLVFNTRLRIITENNNPVKGICYSEPQQDTQKNIKQMGFDKIAEAPPEAIDDNTTTYSPELMNGIALFNLFDMLPDPAMIFSLDYKIQYFNRKARDYFCINNTSRETHKTLDNSMLPELKKFIVPIINQALNTNEKQSAEYKFENNKWFALEVLPITLGDQILNFVIYARDITFQKLSENELVELTTNLEEKISERTFQIFKTNELLESEIHLREEREIELVKNRQRFQGILDHANDAIISIGADMKIIMFNKAAERDFQFSHQDVEGKDIEILIPLRLRPKMKRIINLFFNTQRKRFKATTGENMYGLRKNGNEFPLELSVSKVDFDGEILTTFIMRDVSKELEDHKRMLETHERFITVMNSLDSLVYVSDMDNYEILFINKRVREVFGDVVGQTCYKVFQRNADNVCSFCTNSQLKEINDPDEAVTWEYFNPVLERWFLCHDRLISWLNGRNVRLEIATDVTELKEAEISAQLALDYQKDLSDLKSRFISTITHEYKTPLTAIIGSADMLHNYHNKLSEEKRNKHLNRIKVSASKLNTIIDDVMTISKIESGKMEVNPVPLHLLDFCTDVIEETSYIYNSNEILLEYEGDENSHLDSSLLRIILSNLLSNAIKYSDDNSPIVLKVQSGKSRARFSVSDQGIGIPEKEQSKIFSNFHRSSNVGTRSGTGLGLSIVHQLVNLCYGKIYFDSKENVGTTFHINLPVMTNNA